VSTGLLAPPANDDYRHVVFADDLPRPRRALNLSRGLAGAAPARAAGPLSAEEASFARWLFARAGLDARDYRDETIARRLPACLRVLRAARFEQARALIESDPRRLQTALDAMVIGVTSFFRDRDVFTALFDHVVPMLARGRLNLRVWCAGCSNGAEVYSLAVVLARCGWLHRTHLLGTDCRPGAIAEASAGVHDESSLRALPREWLEQFFIPVEGGRAWRVRPALRTMLRWRVADVLREHEPGPWDMIFCRNLAMYLRTESMARLWQRLSRALRPGGVLVLGKAERPTGACAGAGAALTYLHPCIFRRDAGVS
jgi:chemotaxis methyl-accepting protein methylase